MNNLQNMFDRVVGHLRAQGNPWGDFSERGWSFINNEDPCQRCAKGVLFTGVTDSKAVMNKYNVFSLVDDILKEWNVPVTELNKNLLDSLENIFEHHPQDSWEIRFKALAERHQLEYKPYTAPEVVHTVEVVDLMKLQKEFV